MRLRPPSGFLPRWRQLLPYGLVGIGGLLAVALALAAELPSGWEVTADRMTYIEQPETVIAEGDAVVVRRGEGAVKPFTVYADRLNYDVASRRITAQGNIRLEAADERVSADSAELDLESQTGTLTDAIIFYADSNLYLGGGNIQKTGEFTYTIEDGWASACRLPEGGGDPAWRVKAGSGKVTVDGMALLRDTNFEIKGVPVAYSPLLLFPAKTKRESGFLFPEFSSSTRNGNGLLVPLFIDLSPSVDATLYPGVLEKRGTQLGAEFRYVRDDKSTGMAAVNYLRDRHDDAGDDYKDDGLIRTAVDRYWLRAKADQYFGADLVGRLDLDYVSDRDFLEEFRDGLNGFDRSRQAFLEVYSRSFQEESIPNRESTLQLTRRWDSMLLGGEVRAVQDLDGRDDSVPLQSLPRVNFNGRLPLRTLPLSMAWDTEYIHYWREQGVGAQRFDLQPRLVMPLPGKGAVEGRLSAGVRETLYQVETRGSGPLSEWPDDRTQTRTLPVFEAETSTLLLRHFRPGFKRLGWLGHIVRPGIKYDYMPDSDPDASDAALPELDSVDLFGKKNWLTFELKNYLSAGGQNEKGYFDRNFGYGNIALTYDLEEDQRALAGPDDKRRPFSDLRFDLLVHPSDPLLLRYRTNLSLYGEGVPRYELAGRLANARGDSLGIDYRYLREAAMMEPFLFTPEQEGAVHDIELSGQLRLSRTLLTRGFLNRSLLRDHTVESGAALTYRPECWAVELRTTRSPDDQRYMVIFSLDGIGRAFEWALNDF